MKLRMVLLLIFLFLLGSYSSAAEKKGAASKAKIDQLTNQFFLGMKSNLKDFNPNQPLPPNCYPPGGNVQACVSTVCGFMPSYNCDDQQEILNVAQMCRGNWDGSCVKSACSHLPS